MGAVAYYIFYPLNRIITLLPLRVLYIFSDILFLLLYYFPGYRRNIVSANLKNAFPEKPESERAAIAKKFYRHLADLFIETLKLTHLGKNQLLKRCPVENPEVFEQLYDKGKDIAAILAHYNNWEWMTDITLYSRYTCISIYKPLKNKHFDRFVISLRSKLGMVLTPMSMIARELINYRKEGVRTLTSFLADQTPVKKDIQYWTTFLNQDTPVYLGAEKIASKYDMAVVYFNLRKVRRGYYSMKVEVLFENVEGLSRYEITEAHVKRLESIIRENPEYWVWSHRRWKHKREPANG